MTLLTSTGWRNLLLPLALCLFAQVLLAQNKPKPQPGSEPAQSSDVIRINTELVQTDVMIFDKQGRFVEGLLPEQFELTLDGKPQPISFFDRINTGSAREAMQVAASRRGSKAAAPTAIEADTTNPGRVILFFLDDVHLSGASLIRARKSLLEFVDTRMRDSDQVAIVSTSGQIGFLQQLTDEQVVLREAIARLNNKRNTETYAGRTVITDYQANQIANHNDRDLFNYLVSSTINEYQLVPAKGGDPRGLSQVAVNNVRNRVRQITEQSRVVTADTLGVLLSLMRSTARLPGRKLMFFVSDGFITDARASNAMTMLKRVTEMAAREGIVVYTMDARGTYYAPEIDAGRNDFPDGIASGTSARMPTAETQAMREPLTILAEDTGGRAFVNSNSFADSIQQALDETSAYYLLAWRPETENQRGDTARLKVTIKNRPDLRVRLRRNYYVPANLSTQSNKPTSTSDAAPDSAHAPAPAELKPETELLVTLGSLYPERLLPTALSVGYAAGPDQSATLKLSMQIDRRAFAFDSTDAKKSEVDVIGAAIDDRGIIVSFKQVLSVLPNPAAEQGQPVIWNQQLSVPPGLYQVRVAVRERSSGRTGSARQWIQIPGRDQGSLQMSSLFLGERKPTANEQASAPGAIRVSVDHRFSRGSALRYQTYVYNDGKDNTSAPEVEIQARIVRDGKTLVTMPPAKVPIETRKDQAGLPYWAEISLAELLPGQYQLQVTATNRLTKTSVVQRSRFIVE